MNVGIIGTGNVAKNLAMGLLRAGHKVALGSRTPANVEPPSPKVSIGSRGEAAKFGDVVILAVPYHAVKDAIRAIGPNTLRGKVLVDATNVYSEKGDMAIGFVTSGAEELAKASPGAKVVKAFNTVFAQNMSTGMIGGTKVLALVASDDRDAKDAVLRLAADIGFDAVDAGPLRAARYMEPWAFQMIGLAYGHGRMGPGIGLALVRK